MAMIIKETVMANPDLFPPAENSNPEVISLDTGPLYGGFSPRHAVADAGLVADVGGVVRAFAQLLA